jgi:hypothetical protein
MGTLLLSLPYVDGKLTEGVADSSPIRLQRFPFCSLAFQ